MSASVPQPQRAAPARGTLRLTFESSGGEVRLVKQERLDMICPPFVGEPPQAGRNSGFWVELQDAEGTPTFFRVLHDPLGSSAEIHSPDGNINREFGPPQDTTFEVLLPDEPGSKTLVLMGDLEDPSSKRSKRKAQSAGAHEMARFDLADGSGATDEPKVG